MYEQFGNDIIFKRDIKIVLMFVVIDEVIDGDNLFCCRIEWLLIFEVNGWMYFLVDDVEGLICIIYIDFYVNIRDLFDGEGVFEFVDSEVVF